MSLIQEALKRQQMEQEGKLPPGGDTKGSPLLKSTVVDGETFILPGLMPEPASPEAPEEPEAPAKPALKRSSASVAPPAPEPPPLEKPSDPEPEPDRKRISPTPTGDDGSEKERSRVLPSLAAVIILLLLLAGALVWAITYGLEMAGVRMPWSQVEPAVAGQPVAETGSADGAAAVKVAETPTAKPADTPAGVGVAAPAKKPTIGSVVRQTVKDANAFVDEANVAIADAAGETVVAAEAPATATPATTEPPATAVAATPDVAPPPVPIKWPDITISGVVGKEQKGAVFVNGKVIGVNETVEGIRIVAIKSQGALLEYQGETRLAKVGQPLNRATR